MLGKAASILIASALIFLPATADAAKKKSAHFQKSAYSICNPCRGAKAKSARNRSAKASKASANARRTAPPGSAAAAVAGKLTAYSPQRNGDRMEGGYASSRPGPDRKAIVRTLADVAAGRSRYVTIAGSPKFYGRYYRIRSIQFVDAQGRLHTLKNVIAVVHDTGSAFRRAPEGRFDMPVERDIGNKLMVRNATLWKTAGVSLVSQDRAVLAGAGSDEKGTMVASSRPAPAVGRMGASDSGLFRAPHLMVRIGVKSDGPYMRRQRSESAIKRIIVHGDVNENADVLLRYGQRVDRQRGFDANYHFYIGRDATITQGVPLNRVANHALRANGDSIGVVLAGVDNGRLPTPQQEWAAKALIASLGKTYRISHTKVIGHGELQPGRRHRMEGGYVARDIRAKGYDVPAAAPEMVAVVPSALAPIAHRGGTHYVGMQADGADEPAPVKQGQHFEL